MTSPRMADAAGCGSGTEVLSGVLAVVAAAYGWRRRDELSLVLCLAGLTALALLLGAGLAEIVR